MPWESIKLNSGYYIPSIGFGTWKTGSGQGPIDQVKQALGNGYNHLGESSIPRYLRGTPFGDTNSVAQTQRRTTGTKKKPVLL
ncbi:hypothetical protein EDD22DRAFT_214789 [Suillus occidentalis]|nr:hypothetical protein EDD22DRAFT_214789 [Suillus occidentalis]